MEEKTAIILAGGKGKRLAPYTFVIPKPIVPIGTMPILEIVLRQLAYYGFAKIHIALGHMSEIIRALAGDGSKFGVEILYSDEDSPLGTMGPLKQIRGLPGDFLVMNADLLTDLDFGAFWNYHQEHGDIATVSTFLKTTQLQLGVLQTVDTDVVSGFEEKPVLQHMVSMGIYAFRRPVLEYIPENTYFGFDSLMETLLAEGETIRSRLFAGKWLDIGIPADYERAQEEFENNRQRYLPEHKGRE